MNPRLVSGGSAAFLFSSPIGPRPALDNPERLGTAEIIERVNATHTETKTLFEEASQRSQDLDARLVEIEQKMVRRGGGGGLGGHNPDQTLGGLFAESAELKGFRAIGYRGTARLEVKTITTATAGALVAPDRQVEPLALPRRELTIRDLVAPGRTESNLIYFARQTVRTNNAATVAENPSSAKPQSDIAFDAATSPVRTIAHWVPVSREMMDDAPALRSFIDSEMTYGLKYQEEQQLLYGDGTGTNLLGLVPQASAYVPTTIPSYTPANAVETLIVAMAQLYTALLPPSGIVLHPIDWLKMLSLKDTTGQYIGNGPFGALARVVWNMPIVPSLSMLQGKFLMGAFRDAAQIFDRLDAEILASSEDRDNFVRNMLTIRAEERMAFVVKRPQAFVYGTLAGS